MTSDPLHLAGWVSENRERLAASVEQSVLANSLTTAPREADSSGPDLETLAQLGQLETSLRCASPLLFVDYVRWAKNRLSSDKTAESVLENRLKALRQAIRQAAPTEELAIAVSAPVDDALREFPSMLVDSGGLSPAAPHGALANSYLEALQRGDRKGALQLIDSAAETVPVRELYEFVFGAVQREIGRLWQRNEMSVAEEHYCTAITQLAISRLYPMMTTDDRKQRRLLAMSVDGDLHEIGARMIADFFEMDGWDTFYLGASIPAGEVVQLAIEKKVNLVAISATLSTNLGRVGELIRNLRAETKTATIPILVGGHCFSVDPALAGRLGASATASDAEGAVRIGNRLVHEPDDKAAL